MTIRGQIAVRIVTGRSMVTGKLSAAMTRYSGSECRLTTKGDLQFREPQKLQWCCRGFGGAARASGVLNGLRGCCTGFGGTAETLGVPQGSWRRCNNLGGIVEASDVSQGPQKYCRNPRTIGAILVRL